MKFIIVFSFILTSFEIWMSTATKLFYVLPDNSANNVSCPSQPCATLSQYWLHNGTLPVVSNVEYHFLPGEHHVPANMALQNLHNFSIIGAVSNLSSPVMLICSHAQPYVIDIINSHFVMIKNVWFNHYGTFFSKTMGKFNLKMSCCFSCGIENVIFLQYGYKAFNLLGDTYLHNVKVTITQFSEICCQEISLKYNTCPSWNGYDNQMHVLTINQLFIDDHKKCIKAWSDINPGLIIYMQYLTYNMQISLNNSHFSNMDRKAMVIVGGCSSKVKKIFITNCTFTLVKAYPIIHIILKPVNISIRFINIELFNSQG